MGQGGEVTGWVSGILLGLMIIVVASLFLADGTNGVWTPYYKQNQSINSSFIATENQIALMQATNRLNQSVTQIQPASPSSPIAILTDAYAFGNALTALFGYLIQLPVIILGVEWDLLTTAMVFLPGYASTFIASVVISLQFLFFALFIFAIIRAPGIRGY